MDSLIIGIIALVCCNLFRFPYPMLLAVIIGVTNIIPFFGPFIGAIPCALLILLVSPLKCLYFVIFIFVLQQFDGNILGPKILGDSTGLASFWVLFSILLFGGLFGFVGMVLGVPVFAMLLQRGQPTGALRPEKTRAAPGDRAVPGADRTAGRNRSRGGGLRDPVSRSISLYPPGEADKLKNKAAARTFKRTGRSFFIAVMKYQEECLTTGWSGPSSDGRSGADR